MEWSRNKYNDYYNHYMPWIEDKYLQWFGENKTSYTTKETLKTDVTGDKNVNALQEGVAESVGGQFSKGGLLNPIGEAASKEGFNRAERGAPEAEKHQKSWTESARTGVSSVGGAINKGITGLGGYMTGDKGEVTKNEKKTGEHGDSK